MSERMRAAEDAARIGRVISVSGSQIIVVLEDRFSNGTAPAESTPQVGNLVRTRVTGKAAFGVISGMSIPMPAQRDGETEMKIVEVEMLGEIDEDEQIFRRGISTFPRLGDEVFAASNKDLQQVYACPATATLRIGTVHQDETLPAYVVTDDLLGKHFAILGTTGSGKSCAVSLLLQRLLEQHPHAHILLLDPHNEYPRCFGDKAELFDPDSLDLPYWLFNSEEIVEVISGAQGSLQPEEVAILNEMIPAAKRDHLGDTPEAKQVTGDTPVPYQISELIHFIETTMGKLEKPEKLAPYQRLKSKLENLIRDPRFSFMFRGMAMRDNMAQLLSKIFRIPAGGKPLTIIDLSSVPSEIINVVVSVLARLTFDLALWAERGVPMLLVCEEAHRYAPADSALGFEPTKRTLSRIAKEGRKYGVSLCVVSQRPSEMASEVLSECNTIFALRMSNQEDQDFVRAAMSESAIGLIDFLPSLRNAEAIAVGEGVPFPVRLRFDSLPDPEQPLSGTIPFSVMWTKDAEASAVEDIVARWRGDVMASEARRSP